MVSNLPFGSSVVISLSAQAHLTRVGTLSGRASALSGQLSETVNGGVGHACLGFPAAFQPPAFASRVIPVPPRNWAFLTVGLPGATPSRPDPDGVTTFPTREIRPGWVPPLPRGRRCSPDRESSSPGACRFPTASPYTPRPHPSSEASFHEASTEVHAIHPSGLPLARSPRLEREPLGFPLSFEPLRYQRRTSGRGQATSTDPELRCRHRRPSNLRVHSQRATSCRNLINEYHRAA
jgi:hypothetical protein